MHPTCIQRAAEGPSHLHSCCVCSHITSQWPIGIQRATDGSFAHPTSFQSGQRTLSPAPNRASSRPSCTLAIASQRSCHLPRSCPRRAPASDPTERPAGPLIHLKSRPSDSHHLPDLASQESSPPASQRRAVAATTCTQQTGQQALSFIRNRVPVVTITCTPTSRPSNHPHPNVASQ